jgi:hypothetical protein
MRRPTYVLANQHKDKWEGLVDAWESATTYHREPSDVKVKVGPVGYLRLLGTLAMLGFIAWQAFYTNVYMKEVRPVGNYAHWAGEAGVLELAEQQFNEGTLCKYSPEFDYTWGKNPGEWNYAANTCDAMLPSEFAYKTSTALQFVTYEQRRSKVEIPAKKYGDCPDKEEEDEKAPSPCREERCDKACQSVYENWPSTVTFRAEAVACTPENEPGCWLDRHIATFRHLRLKDTHPNMADRAQIHMQMPYQFGDNCICYSFENIFVLGADNAELVFTHSFEAFEGGVMGSSKEDFEDGNPVKLSPTSFVIARGPSVTQEKPIKVIPPGPVTSESAVKITVKEALEAIGTCLDCQPDAPFAMNGMCDAEKGCDGVYKRAPTPRVSGAAINVRTEYYNELKAMPTGTGYDHIRSNYDPPYAIHVISGTFDWTSRGSDVVLVSDTPEWIEEQDTYRYGIMFKMQGATGVIARFDFGVVVDNLVNFTVLAGFPPMIVGGIVFYALGRKSKLYRRGQRKILTLHEMHRSFAYSAVMAGAIFKALDTDSDGFLDSSELNCCFKDLLLPKLRARFPGESDEFYWEKLNQFAAMMSDEFEVESGEAIKASGFKRGISHTEFIRNCTFNEALDWEDMMEKLIHPDIDADFQLPCRKRKPKVAPIHSA